MGSPRPRRGFPPLNGVNFRPCRNHGLTIVYLSWKFPDMSKPGRLSARWIQSLSALMIAALSLFLIAGCSRKTVRVSGVVWRVTGNQMPSPDMPTPSYGGYATQVYFYSPTNQRDVRRAGRQGFYAYIPSSLVAKASTDAAGRFRVRLTPGRYSVFIGKDSLFYANILDGEGFLHPLVIARDGKRHIELKADWDARY